MLTYLKALYFWTAFVVVTIILYIWLVMNYLFYKAFKPAETEVACHRVATQWGQTVFNLCPGWSYTILGKENLPPDGGEPYVLVANHQSAADIWALYLMGMQFRWLSKDSMFKLPIIGQAMRWAGYVSVTRGNKQSQYAAVESSRKWLRRGVSMIYFPEGTRSADGQMRDFKSGAFRLAQDENLAIVPVALKGTRDMMVKNSAFPKKAALEIEILPPVRNEPGESTAQFALRVRNLIAARLGQAPMTQVSTRS